MNYKEKQPEGRELGGGGGRRSAPVRSCAVPTGLGTRPHAAVRGGLRGRCPSAARSPSPPRSSAARSHFEAAAERRRGDHSSPPPPPPHTPTGNESGVVGPSPPRPWGGAMWGSADTPAVGRGPMGTPAAPSRVPPSPRCPHCHPPHPSLPIATPKHRSDRAGGGHAAARQLLCIAAGGARGGGAAPVPAAPRKGITHRPRVGRRCPTGGMRGGVGGGRWHSATPRTCPRASPPLLTVGCGGGGHSTRPPTCNKSARRSGDAVRGAPGSGGGGGGSGLDRGRARGGAAEGVQGGS